MFQSELILMLRVFLEAYLTFESKHEFELQLKTVGLLQNDILQQDVQPVACELKVAGGWRVKFCGSWNAPDFKGSIRVMAKTSIIN